MKRLYKSNQSSRGFSLVELVVVSAIILVVIAMAVPSIVSSLKEARVRTAQEDVMAQMRRAHEVALDRRRVVMLTFNVQAGATPANIVFTQEIVVPGVGGNPDTFAVAPAVNTPNPETTNLPSDMNFILPTPLPATSPDGLGTPASSATDFGYVTTAGPAALNTMYFQADGTVLRDSEVGAVAGGVIYIGRQNDSNSYRAVSVLGQTGRIKGWRLNQGAAVWSAQ